MSTNTFIATSRRGWAAIQTVPSDSLASNFVDWTDDGMCDNQPNVNPADPSTNNFHAELKHNIRHLPPLPRISCHESAILETSLSLIASFNATDRFCFSVEVLSS